MKSLRLVGSLAVLAFIGASVPAAPPDPLPWSQRAANAAIARWPDGRFAPSGATWNYELGTLLQGMRAVWLTDVDPRDFNYIKNSVDALVTPDGSIPTLKPEEHQLDNILLGRQLLFLYGVTQNKRYLTAATYLKTSWRSSRATPKAATGTSSATPTRCGSTAFTWLSHSAYGARRRVQNGAQAARQTRSRLSGTHLS